MACKQTVHPMEMAPDAAAMMMPPPVDANPHGIALADVTVDAMGQLYPAGLSRSLLVVGNGAAIGDLDGDGLPDMILARVSRDDIFAVGPTQILWNESHDGRIQFRADDTFGALIEHIPVYGVALGDYDGDGRLDIFLGCEGYDHLFHNEGNRRFTDVTERAGVKGIRTDFTAGAVWFDANDDGLLDLYVTDYVGDMFEQDVCSDPNTKNRLFLNLGDGTFYDASAESGTENCGATFTAAAVDLDGDGQLELYLANDTFASNFMPAGNFYPRDALFVRTGVSDTGVPRYVNHAKERGIQDERATMGIGLADFDGDGNLDVYLSNLGATQLYLWRPAEERYEEAGKRFGLDQGKRDNETLVSWGVLPLDLDHDGALEVVVVHGTIALSPETSTKERYEQMTEYFRQAERGQPFDDITTEVGLPNTYVFKDDSKPHSGRGAYLGDLDRDGRLDLLIGAFNEPFRLYQNQTPDDKKRHFLRLRLTGTVSSPDPVGALIQVTLDDGTLVSRQHTAGGLTFGNGDFVDDIGLGERTPAAVSVTWPSGLVERVDTLPGFAVDQEFSVREPAWLELSARVAKATDPAPVLTYHPSQGPMEASTASVSIARSDQKRVVVTASADGTITAAFPHPGTARRTRITLTRGGQQLKPHPIIDFR